MMNNVCLVCRFDDYILRDMDRVIMFLQRHHLENNCAQHDRFDFGNSPRCRFGMTCNKVSSARSQFTMKEQKLNELLNAYIDQTDCSDRHELLRMLQGRFPQAYKQVETAIRKKGSEENS